MGDSVFTKIVRKEIPAFVLYEDEQTLAFLDHNPVTEGHTLVITKQPIDHLDDCPPELHRAIFETVHKLSKHLKKKLYAKRIALVVHGEEVPHAHIHLVPMYTGKELSLANRTDAIANASKLLKVQKKLRLSGKQQ